MNEEIITREYLINNRNHIFVFGDNFLRRGKKGAAVLRDEPNTYGFITKKYPNNKTESFFSVKEYEKIYEEEIFKLIRLITSSEERLFLISKLGFGLANKNKIFEKIIEPRIKKDLEKFSNVKFLW